MKTTIIILLLITQNIISQQQYDIPWATLGDTPWPIHQRDPQATGRANVIGPQKGLVKWTLDIDTGIEVGPILWFNNITVNNNLHFHPFLYFSQNGKFLDTLILPETSNNHLVVWYDSSIITTDNYRKTIIINNNLRDLSIVEREFFINSKSRVVPTLDSCFIVSGGVFDSIVQYYIYKFNINGDIIWKKNYSDFIDGRISAYGVSLSPDGKTLYTTGQYNSFIAADVETGNYKWHFNVEWNTHLPIVDNENNIYFSGSKDDSTFLFSLDSAGVIRWKYFICEGIFQSESSPTIDYNGNISFMILDKSADVTGIASVDYWGNERWIYRFERKEYFSTPLLCDSLGNVYGGRTYFGDFTYGAISSEGKLLWEIPIEDRKRVLFTGAFGSDGTLYIGTCKSALAFGLTKTLMAISDDTTTSVKQDETIPQNFSLSQNYPNPFNPSTIIQYVIASDNGTKQSVSLIVYDILGNEVATLVNENQSAGSYNIIFDASKLSSGIYYYKLVAGDFVRIKKMMLLK